jgi:hypothetical protein
MLLAISSVYPVSNVALDTPACISTVLAAPPDVVPDMLKGPAAVFADASVR